MILTNKYVRDSFFLLKKSISDELLAYYPELFDDNPSIGQGFKKVIEAKLENLIESTDEARKRRLAMRKGLCVY